MLAFFNTCPLVLIITCSIGISFPADSMALFMITGRPEQQGTSMTRAVMLLILADLKISVNFWIYWGISSNLGQPTTTTFPLIKSWCRVGYAMGTQSATTKSSASFKKGAVGGTK